MTIKSFLTSCEQFVQQTYYNSGFMKDCAVKKSRSSHPDFDPLTFDLRSTFAVVVVTV